MLPDPRACPVVAIEGEFIDVAIVGDIAVDGGVEVAEVAGYWAIASDAPPNASATAPAMLSEVLIVMIKPPAFAV
jgi:hypothetical protein